MLKKTRPIFLVLSLLFVLCTATACDSGSNEETPLPEQGNQSALPESSAPETVLPELPMPEQTPPSEPIPEPEPEPVVKTVRYIKINTDGLNVRGKPSTSATVLGQVDSDVSMLYLGMENGFYKTYYRNQTAYVSAKSAYSRLFEMKYTHKITEDVVTEGCKLIGTPYVYGAVRYHDGNGKKNSGFTVKKFDCSSLMQYIFYMANGTLLQVNTRTQIYQGKTVKKSDLQRGDLIFFTNDARRNRTGVERVGHVAMYLGDNLILHTASDYCKIEEVSAKRWRDYIEAKRMITE